MIPVDKKSALLYHLDGKIGMRPTKPLAGPRELCLAYTPGVAQPVKEIRRDPCLIHTYTSKDRLVAIVTDGTAVLGLGDMSPEASIPVMEGKAVLFKAFADIDGWPVPLANCRLQGRNTGPTDPARVIDAVCALAPMYGGINLEDIAAPACFEIEDQLDEMLDIPVFHDDQWGTAVITLAGVMNYCLLSERQLMNLRVVINGAGAAGIRIAEMLKASGAKDIILCDSKGVLRTDRKDLSEKKREHAVDTRVSSVGEAMRGANVFIGVSVADCITREDVLSMDSFPAVFAMANPDPEIRPEEVEAAMGASPYLMATGRSDYPNQINNVLGFPFLFRGALDVKARTINVDMKIAAAQALATVAREPVADYVRDLFSSVQQNLEFGRNCVIPKPFDRRLYVEVSHAVAKAAVESGAAATIDLDAYRKDLERRNEQRFTPRSDSAGLSI